ncbi:hypothetical protein FOMPIDRAFT_128261 [Fomitopsis schrenkii]|uniref:Glucosamine 6-phosphate N-acetyltransferase n=1 Tax=Fomitopsis schrenkii TaxID=2126942 RepID=S8F1Y7_FOMSC|nr:hypothetical protein FOMPIDRAFT_128261 [Fomitopsis schrenkii]
MPFTPDSDLVLLFSADRIPTIVRTLLPTNVHMRPLASTDYKRGHLDVLSHLSTVADPGEDAWIARFYELRSVPLTYYTIVIVDMRTDRIVATGTIYIERKFIRGLGAVGHFEDVAVGRLQQGRQLGLCIAKALVEISEGMGCYKTTGDCLDRNIPPGIPWRNATALLACIW